MSIRILSLLAVLENCHLLCDLLKYLIGLRVLVVVGAFVLIHEHRVVPGDFSMAHNRGANIKRFDVFLVLALALLAMQTLRACLILD